MREAIKSDDPRAVEKLDARIAKLEALIERVSQINKIIRSSPKNKFSTAKYNKLVELGLSPGKVESLFVPDFCGDIGIPGYVNKNDRANLRRLKERREELAT